MSYVLGVDIGTSSVKAVLLEPRSGAVAADRCLPTAADLAGHRGALQVLTATKDNNKEQYTRRNDTKIQIN